MLKLSESLANAGGRSRWQWLSSQPHHQPERTYFHHLRPTITASIGRSPYILFDAAVWDERTANLANLDVPDLKGVATSLSSYLYLGR